MKRSSMPLSLLGQEESSTTRFSTNDFIVGRRLMYTLHARFFAFGGIGELQSFLKPAHSLLKGELGWVEERR